MISNCVFFSFKSGQACTVDSKMVFNYDLQLEALTICSHEAEGQVLVSLSIVTSYHKDGGLKEHRDSFPRDKKKNPKTGWQGCILPGSFGANLLLLSLLVYEATYILWFFDLLFLQSCISFSSKGIIE